MGIGFLTQSDSGRHTLNNRPPDETDEWIYINYTTADILRTTQDKGYYKRRYEIFEGACLDTGAVRCVIGKGQAKAYCRDANMKYILTYSKLKFRFGDGGYPSLGKLIVRIPIPNGSYIQINVDVVAAPIPLLLGLDVMDREGVIANNVRNQLQNPGQEWYLPIIRKYGHMYITWDKNEVLFTRPELIKLHRHFKHPDSQKLWNLIQRAKPDQVDTGTRNLLEEITKACETCQVFSASPERFRVSLPPTEIAFNREVAIDLMWLEGKAILHVVDVETRFNSAMFLKAHTVEAVWEAFVACWATLYIGFPETIRVDQGSAFTSVRWTRRCDSVGTNLKYSGVESHNSLGAGEQYHAPLRRIYLKIRTDHPKIAKETTLRLAIKAMNDTMGPNGSVPSLLVFGCLPRFPSVNSKVPEQVERMDALQAARREMETITAETRIRKALSSRVPRNADLIISPGDSVRVFRETDRRYIGPFKVIRVDDKQVYVLDGNREVQYNITQILPSTEYDAIVNGDHEIDTLYSQFSVFRSADEHLETAEMSDTFITEILERGDGRLYSPEAESAKKRNQEP